LAGSIGFGRDLRPPDLLASPSGIKISERGCMKIIWVLVGILLSGQTFAATEITLKISNHMGFSKTEMVEVRDSKADYYNGILVNHAGAANVQKALTQLSSLPAAGSESCASGRFQYTLRKNGKIQSSYGCAEGQEFALKYMAFQQLKKQVIAE
jgi:hypothetical protein